MFNANDFKQIVNNTTDLLEQVKKASEDDAEELNLRIDSNIHALRIVWAEISDPEIKQEVLRIIQSFDARLDFQNAEQSVTQMRSHTPRERSELIEREMYMNAAKLKQMARNFSDSLNADSKIVGSLGKNMAKNSVETTQNLHSLNENSGGFSAGTYLFVGFIIFIIMYFIIKFL